jgi:hypothetical protein
MTTFGVPGLDRIPYRLRVGSIIPLSRNGFSIQSILTISASSRSSGFYPPHCYQASSALSPQSYPWICHPLSPGRFGFTYAVRFYDIFGNLKKCQPRRASLGKTHLLSISRPTSQRVGSPDIRSCSATPARPPPHCHIVGSLFATYMGSASCFLRTPHFWKLPLPCWRCPSVR